MKNLIKIFGKYIGLAIMLFITGALYYTIWQVGIDSFYAPMVGVIAAVILPFVCVSYYIFFVRKVRDKNTFGK